VWLRPRWIAIHVGANHQSSRKSSLTALSPEAPERLRAVKAASGRAAL
jgi:hypothetical protein